MVEKLVSCLQIHFKFEISGQNTVEYVNKMDF